MPRIARLSRARAGAGRSNTAECAVNVRSDVSATNSCRVVDTPTLVGDGADRRPQVSPIAAAQECPIPPWMRPAAHMIFAPRKRRQYCIANRFSGGEDHANLVGTYRDYHAESAPSGLRKSCDGARDHGARG